jgi:hypothetical protein
VVKIGLGSQRCVCGQLGTPGAPGATWHPYKLLIVGPGRYTWNVAPIKQGSLDSKLEMQILLHCLSFNFLSLQDKDSGHGGKDDSGKVA